MLVTLLSINIFYFIDKKRDSAKLYRTVNKGEMCTNFVNVYTERIK